MITIEIIRNLAWLGKCIISIIHDSLNIHSLHARIRKLIKKINRNEIPELNYRQAKQDYKNMLKQNDFLV